MGAAPPHPRDVEAQERSSKPLLGSTAVTPEQTRQRRLHQTCAAKPQVCVLASVQLRRISDALRPEAGNAVSPSLSSVAASRPPLGVISVESMHGRFALWSRRNNNKIGPSILNRIPFLTKAREAPRLLALPNVLARPVLRRAKWRCLQKLSESTQHRGCPRTASWTSRRHSRSLRSHLQVEQPCTATTATK